MKVVLKVGGTLLDTAQSRTAIANQLAAIAATHRTVIVHGGGKQMTRFLDERGIVSEFRNGLRVSDPPVIDAALHVIAGAVNKQLVTALRAEGQPAFGLSGLDGLLTPAERMSEDLGWVGRAGETRGELLDLLVSAGLLPVVACIAGDDLGTVYNVNADQMAVSCAIAFRAEKLVFLTDVSGVKDEDGRVIPFLAPAAVTRLIESGIAHGGMQAKLLAASDALQRGVREVLIAPGHDEAIADSILAGEKIGTQLGSDDTQFGGAHA